MGGIERVGSVGPDNTESADNVLPDVSADITSPNCSSSRAPEKRKRATDDGYEGDDEGKKGSGEDQVRERKRTVTASANVHVLDNAAKEKVETQALGSSTSLPLITTTPRTSIASKQSDTEAASDPGTNGSSSPPSFPSTNAQAAGTKHTDSQHRPQLKHGGVETLEPHPTDPSKLIARFKIHDPSGPVGTFLQQVDEIPVWNKSLNSLDIPQFYFKPSILDAKVPGAKRPNQSNNHQPPIFAKQPDGSWTRPSGQGEPDKWQPVDMFRRFNTVTHRYEEAYVNPPRLENIDPNDKDWANAYNKWIDQFRRRRDHTYTKVARKDLWSTAERRALMAGVNVFVTEHGLHNFGFCAETSMTAKDVRKMADSVNAVGGMARQVDSVRAQLSTSHPRKNKAVYDLLHRADDIRARLANNEEVPHEQLFPSVAIPESQWPDDSIQEKKELREKGLLQRKPRQDKGKTRSHGIQKVQKSKQKAHSRFSTLVFTVGIFKDLMDYEVLLTHVKKRKRDEEDAAKLDAEWCTTDEEIMGDEPEVDTEDDWCSTDEELSEGEGDSDLDDRVNAHVRSAKRRRLS